MTYTKETKQLIRDAQKWTGWRVEQTKKGWMLYPADKSQRPVAVHKTPSDWRGWANLVSELRRKGAPI